MAGNHKTARLARLVAQHRAVIGGAGRRRSRLPRQIMPVAIEGEYARAIGHYVREAREALAPLFRELPGLLRAARAERGLAGRTDAGEGQRVRELVEAARKKMGEQLTTAELDRLGRLFAQQTATYQRVQLNKQVREALGVDIFMSDERIMPLLEGFAAENAALVTRVPQKVIDDVEAAATRAVTGGLLYEDLQDELEQSFGFGEKRARLIARDQIGKLYGQVNASRQQDIGVSHYIWRTSNDDRVRGKPDGKYPDAEVSHWALEGRRFRYGDPNGGADGLLPGEDYQCRCFAEPSFDEIFEELE